MKKILLYTLLNHSGTLILGSVYVAILSAPSIALDQALSTRRIIALILVLPFIETIIFQLIPVELARKTLSKITVNGFHIWKLAGLLLSSFSFFYAHLIMNGKFNGFVYGTIGGAIFATLYLVERNRGWKHSLFSTWVCHALSNTLTVLSLFLFGSVSYSMT